MTVKPWQYAVSFSVVLAMTSSLGLAAPAKQPIDSNPSPLSQLPNLIKSAWVATISVGPLWENAGSTQTFYLAPDVEKTYVADDIYHALVDGEIFLGIQQPLRHQLTGQIGLAVATTGEAPLSGTIWHDADPQFDNYTYRYKIKHTHVAIKGKLLADRGYAVIPWISGSLGAGFNQAHDFNNTPTISEAVTIPNFTNNTVTAFTYTVGAGVQHSLNAHWQIGLGYEFADWGRSHLGMAPGQVYNTGLSLAHLFTNGFLCNLSYSA